MAAIHFLRHGQASFGASDYDQLSELGYEQGRIVGAYYREHLTLDAIFCGSLQRHQATLEAFNQGFGRDDLPLTQLPELNEFDHQNVLECYRPQWRDKTVMRKEIAEAEHPWRYFQEIFVAAVTAWVKDEHEYSESWLSFQARVQKAFKTIREATPSGGRVLVVTSGGPIAVVCQQVLELSDGVALNLNHTLKNASVTEVLFHGDTLSLSYFNDFSCLLARGKQFLSHR